ncbi:sulfotransferase family 2 domain-containing protein [Pseudoalteromonas sp. bablab_jr010]|uniref:sulfotransferase family 2 domain-containing protein n=1 Tax=Pseudoalteromonas sp. bablab_jr010 TaxID=2755063 RepID=UPI0018F570F4|nr:sulfotransferase family 2 domain-containing protein [Pseudoalteromonas sp. bablab_jr010]
MLISNTHKFIFVHIWKAGGTSVRKSLSNYTNNDKTQIPKHASLKEIINYIGNENFSKYFSFSFVRNPWDIQVSNYFYIRQRPEHYAYEWMSKFECFDEYIEWRVSEERILQFDMICDSSEKIAVNFVGKFEKLNEDFRIICNKIGVNAKLPHTNRSTHQNYRKYYTPFSKKLIEVAYEKDIEHFGYKY